MSNLKTNSKPSVFILGNQRLYRECLSKILSEQPGLLFAGSAELCRGEIETVLALRPDVVLINCETIDDSICSHVKVISRDGTAIKPLLHAPEADDSNLLKAIQAGAMGFLSSNTSICNLLHAVAAVSEGQLWVNRTTTARLLNLTYSLETDHVAPVHPDNSLTDREREVLDILIKGGSNKEIGLVLYISDKTVKSHLNRIYKKLRVTSRFEAIVKSLNMNR